MDRAHFLPSLPFTRRSLRDSGPHELKCWDDQCLARIRGKGSWLQRYRASQKSVARPHSECRKESSASATTGKFVVFSRSFWTSLFTMPWHVERAKRKIVTAMDVVHSIMRQGHIHTLWPRWLGYVVDDRWIGEEITAHVVWAYFNIALHTASTFDCSTGKGHK